MSLYSVCSLTIQAEKLSHRFSPFLVYDNPNPGKIDLTIEYIPELIFLEKLEKIAEFSFMTVWKEKLLGNHYNWIYTLKKINGTICVDEDFTRIRVYYDDFDGCLRREDVGEPFSPYIQSLLEFKLIKSGFAILHSACIESDGYAYAFTGPSGIGKSSRAAKWCKCFSAEWISGDRPAIDVCNRIAYGVPWDGKECVFRNVRYPLAAILKVKRSENTAIYELTEKEKISFLCEQTVFPMWDLSLAMQAMRLIRQTIHEIPIYEISCDITDESTFRSRELIMDKLIKKGALL